MLKRWTILAVAVAAVAAATTTWLLWPDPPRQREYLDGTACLLTDARGVTGDPARPTWAAMQSASVSTLVKVQYLAVAAPQTAANARAHLNSLAGGRCGLVVAVGPAQTAAVTAAAASFPEVRFVTVGGGKPAANVSVITAESASSLDAAIRREISTLADDAS